MAVPQQYYEAGRIASEARNRAEKAVRPGMKVLEICEAVEGFMRERGARPAFPCNVSLNEVAAHYTADFDDSTVVQEGDVVKIDLGAHLDGYLVDTAVTVCLNPAYEELTRATRTALEEAIRASKEGIRVGEIGRVIARVAEQWGFRPISNLSGHSIERFVVHAGTSIPNVWVPGTRELKANAVYAIEPFLTAQSSYGRVAEGRARNIYSLIARRPSGDRAADRFAETVWDEYRTLPFAPRYFADAYGKEEMEGILRRLLGKKILRVYPELVEPSGKMVAQFEHTMVLTEAGPVVLTQ